MTRGLTSSSVILRRAMAAVLMPPVHDAPATGPSAMAAAKACHPGESLWTITSRYAEQTAGNNKGCESGFRTCADAVKNSGLKRVFEDAARKCDEGAKELEAKLRSLGKEPAASGTAAGTLHRAWTNIKSSVTGMDDHAVLAECERGEDVAKRAYAETLIEDLPRDVKELVQHQYAGVKANHNCIRNLRDQTAHL